MTESPASCDSLSLFDELFFIKQKYPHIPVSEMLSWVTTNPARALGMGHTLGVCAPDACADLIALRVPVSSQEDVLEEMFESDPDISFVMVNGEEVIVDY
jgi:imidazolonepropionase-like amidohydrolase